MKLNKGDRVKHKVKEEWGVGEILKIDATGKANVRFMEMETVAIPQAIRFLVKLDDDGREVKRLEKLTKGQRIIYKKQKEWGIGELLQDSYGPQANIFFSNVRNKIIQRKHDDIVILEGQDASDSYLDNLSRETIKNKGTVDKIPFPQIVENFLNLFKGGLYGPVLEYYERDYKVKASQKFLADLSESEFKRLIENELWEEVAGRIKKCHALNLLSKFETIKFGDVLKERSAQQHIAKGLFELLYGQDDLQIRFEKYVICLAEFECDKWPIITLPLFLCFPVDNVFIKPDMTKEAAANRDFDIQYDSKLNWNTYAKVRSLYDDIHTRLSDDENKALHPRDMIDVQTFLWCTYTKGWTEQEVAKAEDELRERSKSGVF